MNPTGAKPPAPGPVPTTLASDEPTSPVAASAGGILRRLFLEEASAHLHAVETALSALGRAEGQPAQVEATEQMLRHLHTLKGAAGSVGLDGIGDAAHELEEMCVDIHACRLEPTLGVLDRLDEAIGTLGALLEGARDASAAAELLPRVPTAGQPAAAPVITEYTLRINATHLEALQEDVGDLVILRTRVERRLRDLESGLRDLARTKRGLREALRALGRHDGRRSARAAEAMARLAGVDLELEDARGHLERAGRSLSGEVETLRRLTTHLDVELRRARKVPLAWAFQRLPQTLRELEHTTGREAVLTVTGGEIEVDKALAEQLAEALLHLLRNAMAHGIETPVERLRGGKPHQGRIEVSAREEGERVHVAFADDGRGLDRDEIRRALVRRGRLGPDEIPSEAALKEAIFEAGFSSRRVADRLAGRGLGLNIVKRAALRAGGDVTVEDVAGKGTRFVISAPQHGAITLAVLFKVAGQVYAIPAAHVERATTLARRARTDVPAASDPARPVLRLPALLGGEPHAGRGAAALDLRYGAASFTVTCDKIIGPRTIVVRPLGPLLAGLGLFSGVTISGAGKAQLVLDVAALAEAAAHPSGPATAPHKAAPRVLVVDDSRLQRDTTARALQMAGIAAVTAEDGLEAWELLGERHFDALVTDLEMPRLGGLDLIARIRHEPALRALPVVVVSSRTARAPRERALAAGADAILPKSPHRKLLLDTLTGLLARAAMERARASAGRPA